MSDEIEKQDAEVETSGEGGAESATAPAESDSGAPEAAAEE